MLQGSMLFSGAQMGIPAGTKPGSHGLTSPFAVGCVTCPPPARGLGKAGGHVCPHAGCSAVAAALQNMP